MHKDNTIIEVEGNRVKDKHVTIANVLDWVSPIPLSNALILEHLVVGQWYQSVSLSLADAIADLLNGTYTIAQLRNAILNVTEEV